MWPVRTAAIASVSHPRVSMTLRKARERAASCALARPRMPERPCWARLLLFAVAHVHGSVAEEQVRAGVAGDVHADRHIAVVQQEHVRGEALAGEVFVEEALGPGHLSTPSRRIAKRP